MSGLHIAWYGAAAGLLELEAPGVEGGRGRHAAVASSKPFDCADFIAPRFLGRWESARRDFSAQNPADSWLVDGRGKAA